MGVFVKWQGWRTNTVHYIEKSTFGSNTFSHHFTHCHVRIFDRKSKRWQGGSYHSCLAGMAVSCPTETRYSSYVRIESMGQVWPNPMSWALREICRGARKSPPILAEHCNAGHQTSMERRQTSFACLGWWKNFHRCVCVELLGNLQENRWCLFCFMRRQTLFQHVETYWNILTHVETCWNVETILTDCRNPMDITISSSYASKTQCFFHNSAFWNIGMCNLQSVYDRRLPRNQTIFSMRPQRTTTGATSNTANITKHHETMDSTCCTDIYIYIYNHLSSRSIEILEPYFPA
jgi:hypothetical protein